MKGGSHLAPGAILKIVAMSAENAAASGARLRFTIRKINYRKVPDIPHASGGRVCRAYVRTSARIERCECNQIKTGYGV